MTQKHKILMLLENNPYPRDVRVRQEAQTLREAGHTVMVISQKAPDQPTYEVVNGVRTYRYPTPPEFDGFLGYVLEYGVAMVAMLFISIYVKFRHGFTVIHAHNPPDFPVVIALLFKPFGTKFVFDHHDLAPEMYSTRGGSNSVTKVLQYFERLTCRTADLIIETNESYKQLDIERNGANADAISIVRNGPSQKMLERMEPDETWQNKAPHILAYLGEIGVNDGVDYLMRALDVLRDKRTDWHCIIIGDGMAKPDAEKAMHDLNLTEYVSFLGWQPKEKFLPLLAAATIGVEPIPKNDYTNRSTMIKIMEYMSRGLPVVAFDLHEHQVSAQDAAVYAKANDEAAFAQAISDLMDDPEKRARMSAAGTERVKSTLLWDHQARNLVEAYERL